MSGNNTIWQRLVSALKGADKHESRTLAALRLQLEERNREVERVKKEYALQREQARLQGEQAVGDALEGIVRECAAPLATLAAMEARHRKQGDLHPPDLFRVVASLQTPLARRGMEQIGQVGEELSYDPALHQVLDNARLEPGDSVRIRFVGFRFNGKLVSKAQVGILQSPGDISGI